MIAWLSTDSNCSCLLYFCTSIASRGSPASCKSRCWKDSCNRIIQDEMNRGDKSGNGHGCGGNFAVSYNASNDGIQHEKHEEVWGYYRSLIICLH